jgi:hypothetical protein
VGAGTPERYLNNIAFGIVEVIKNVRIGEQLRGIEVAVGPEGATVDSLRDQRDSRSQGNRPSRFDLSSISTIGGRRSILTWIAIDV